MGFKDANNLHLAPNNRNNTSSLNFYRPDALLDAQPTVSEHWRFLLLLDSVNIWPSLYSEKH